MGEGFNRFKKRMRLVALLKCVSVAVSLGLLALAALLIVVKVVGLDLGGLAVLWYALAAFLPAAAGFGISWLRLMPNDKRVAKTIDTALDFSERAQTMVEFKDSDEAMATLQREDADLRLKGASLKVIRTLPKRIVAFSLALFVAVAAMTTAFIIPTYGTDEGSPGVTEKPVDADAKQHYITILRDWVQRLENGQSCKCDGKHQLRYVQESLKNETIANLNTLIGVIEANDRLSVMKIGAVRAVTSITNNVAKVNTTLKFAPAFKSSTIPSVLALGNAFDDKSSSAAKTAIESFESELQKAVNNGDSDTVNTLVNELRACTENAEVGLNDPLRMALTLLYGELNRMMETSDFSNLSSIVKSSRTEITAQLRQQSDNQPILEISDEIYKIFLLTEEDFISDDGTSQIPEGITPGQGGERPPADEQDPDQEQTGGVGSGETNYASDDKIYWPDLDEYVSYGEILDEAYAAAMEKIESGEYDQATIDAIKAYFTDLYSKHESNKNENNDN